MPWGYRRAADKRGIEPDPETAPLRALVFDLYATGNYTFATLSDELNSCGVRIGALGKHLRAFTKFTVSDVLSNPVVTGTLTWRAKRIDGERRSDSVAPIIPVSTWQRVREIASGRRIAQTRVAERRHN